MKYEKLIKHFVDRADGFNLEEMRGCDGVELTHKGFSSLPLDPAYYDDEFIYGMWPLFLQSALEGINISKSFEVYSNPYCVWVRGEMGLQYSWYFAEGEDNDYNKFVGSIIEAKIRCLEWIMEKELLDD